MEETPKALHLTAAMQVVRAHQRRRHVSVDDTRRAILEAMYSMSEGIAGPETQALAEKLERMTGCSLVELALLIQDWPD